MKVGLLGAFGINNAGDNLEAIASEMALKETIKDLEVTIFSPAFEFLGRPNADRGTGFEWVAVNPGEKDFWSSLLDYDALIIGGGGLMVPAPEFEPFILSGKNIEVAKLPKTAWNALGSQWAPLNDPALWSWYKKLKKAADIIDYISVRSITTARLLEGAGCPRERINLVPDPVINLKIADIEKVQESLRKRFHIYGDKPVLGVSVGPELMKYPLKGFMDELGKALNAIQESGRQVLMFPIGLMYGDDLACKKLWQSCPQSRLIEEPLSAVEVWALVGILDAYLSVRYHGIIAAIASGVPALALDCYLSNDTCSSKIRDLICQAKLEGYYYSPILGICEAPMVRSFLIPESIASSVTGSPSADIANRIERLFVPDSRREWAQAGSLLKGDVVKHFEKMASALGLL